MPINHQNNESRYINPRTQRRSVRKVLYPGGSGDGVQGIQGHQGPTGHQGPAANDVFPFRNGLTYAVAKGCPLVIPAGNRGFQSGAVLGFSPADLLFVDNTEPFFVVETYDSLTMTGTAFYPGGQFEGVVNNSGGAIIIGNTPVGIVAGSGFFEPTSTGALVTYADLVNTTHLMQCIPWPVGSGSGFQGPQGTDGPQGHNGVQGSNGPMGPQGVNGIQGTDGFQGDDGIDGPQGNDGTDGLDGFQGPQGDDGLDGLDGFQGNDGDDGFQGPQGFNGVQGNQGPMGLQGSSSGGSGSQGFQGVQGIQGAQGIQGIQGVQGVQGTGNLTIEVVHLASITNVSATGTTAVDGITPTNGDHVLLTAQAGPTNRGIYVVNTGGAWTQYTTDFTPNLVFITAGNNFQGTSMWLTGANAYTSVVGVWA